MQQEGGLKMPSLSSLNPLAPLTAAGDTVKGISTGITNNAGIIIAGVVIFILIFVGVLMLAGIIPSPFAKSKAAKAAAAAKNANALGGAVAGTGAAGSIKEGFQMPTVPAQEISSEDSTIVNLQPLSIKHAGFTGPYPDGIFDPETATANALKAGFRFLTLQIDYMTTTKKGFEEAGEPTLIVRSDSGAVVSTNSGSIAAVAQTIANMGFGPEVPHNTHAIILYLHVVSAPNRVKNPDGYIKFLSKIAKALNPLAPMHLGMNPLGNFTRQKLEDTLLSTPISSLTGQVIILSNANTTPFRKSSKSSTRYNPDEDLDFFVNMRVYLEAEEDSNGITQLATSDNRASAVLVDLKRVLTLSPEKKDEFAEKGKSRFVIGMGPNTTNPTAVDLDIAINTLGINSVPLDIFSEETATVLDMVSEYSNMPYHPKPSALRDTQ